MTIVEIANKLIGPVEPIGCAHRDEERLKNLAVMIELAEALVNELRTLSDLALKNEASVKAIAIRAAAALEEMELSA